MLTDQSKRRMAAVAMFLTPVGLVWGTGNFLGGPANVEAGELTPAIADPGEIPVMASAATTDAQRAAAMRVLALRDRSFGPTPLYHTESGRAVEPVNTGVPAVPKIFVGMILASSNGNFAMIDGERYQVGDALRDTGWTIIDIDAVERSVTIDDREYDRTRKFFVDRPTDINIRTSPAQPGPGRAADRQPPIGREDADVTADGSNDDEGPRR